MRNAVLFFLLFLTMGKTHGCELETCDQGVKDVKRTQTEIVCEAGLKSYTAMNQVWSYPAPDEAMGIESDLWEIGTVLQRFTKDDKPLVARMRTFVLKDEPRSMCQALDTLISSPAMVDCTLALVTSQVFIIRALMGDTLFERYAELMYASLKNKYYFFTELTSHFVRANGTPSDRGYFYHITNVAQYGELYPDGFDGGHNVFCVGPDRYVGFGEFYKDGPRSEKEIAESLYQSYVGVLRRHRDANPHFRTSIETEATFHKQRTERQKRSQTKIHVRHKTYTEKGLSYLISDLMLAALD